MKIYIVVFYWKCLNFMEKTDTESYMGTNCAPLIADLILFCYERDFMIFLSDDKQAEITQAFNSRSKYLDNLLNIDNPYFKGMHGESN